MLSTVARLMARSTRIVGYRGAGRMFAPLSRIKVLGAAEGTAALGPTARISFPAFDPYWGQYLWTGKAYEPDVEAVFRLLAQIPSKTLVDCGANIGFWTVRLSDPAYGFSSFVAVEPNPDVFRYLRKNIEDNGIPAVAHHAAIAECAGDVVHIDASKGHAAGKVGASGLPVPTVSLKSLLHAQQKAGGARWLVVVKLDVEGCEVPAVKGAAGLDGVDLMFVYEDWPRSGLPVSRFLLDEGYTLFGVHPDGRTESLAELEAVFDFNRRSFPGYHPSNLLATKSPQLVPVHSGASVDSGS